MMKIVKIKLINWHIFSNETISFNNNLLVTGENGCGKSTLMDAIYYLMSAGDDKSFNQAAGQGGNRTLETYMRCKVGNEGQEYIRQGSDVISYIAIEMLSENNNRRSVLGVCLEIVENNKPRPHFYYIPDYTIRDSDYINEKKVYSYNEFKNKLQNINGYYDLTGKRKWEIRQEIGANIFRIKDYNRFYELLKKAISFNPITEVSSFVNEFLLESDNVDLDSLIVQIRNYQDFKKMIEREEEKTNFLETFINQAEQYVKNSEISSNSEIILDEKEIVNNNYKINKANEALIKLEDENDKLQQESDLNSKRIEELIQNINDLDRNDELKLLNESNKKLEYKNLEYSDLNRRLNAVLEEINVINELGQLFGFKHNLRKDIQSKDYSSLKIHLLELKTYLDKTLVDLISERQDLESDKRSIKSLLDDKNNELDNLKKGISTYKKETLLLMELLKNKVKEEYPYDEVYIKPFCEYLEVKDDEWADALEGFLDHQRFNLIIDPKYFDIAAKEYERIKDQNSIYGVGLVNIAAIKDPQVIENSLYDKIKTENTFADIYAKKLLGNVKCCEDISKIKEYKSSITKNVMIYKNNVLKACHPNVYKKPYLGLKSRQIRIDLLTKDINDLNEELKKIHAELDLINPNIIKLQKGFSIRLEENLWQKISLVEKEIKELEIQIKELKANKSLIDNAELSEKYKKEKANLKYTQNEIQAKIRNNIASITNLERDINNFNENINNLNSELRIALNRITNIPLLDSYRAKYKDYKIDDLRAVIDKANHYNSKEKQFLTNKITFYSTHFNASLPNSLYNLDDYINEYNRLLNEAIADYKEKADNAYKTAQESFKKDFMAKLKEKIDRAQARLKSLNKKLKEHTFGTDEEIFSFEFGPSKDKEYAEYYRVIESGTSLDVYSLLDNLASSKDQEIMKQLFNKISINSEDENSEKMLSNYLDYRKYMNYDIKIVNKNNKVSYFSKINKEKSGGETQTPFYIIMAACFEELLGKEDSVCCIILDEAFNNMDENRIKSMMEFYQELKMQVIIIVPTNRVSAIFPYCDTIVGIVKKKNRAKIAPIQKNEKH